MCVDAHTLLESGDILLYNKVRLGKEESAHGIWGIQRGGQRLDQ